MKLIKHNKALTFLCGNCSTVKTSKTTVDCEERDMIICNGCYGQLLKENK